MSKNTNLAMRISPMKPCSTDINAVRILTGLDFQTNSKSISIAISSGFVYEKQ